MSYLHPVRLVFYGKFQADVSTVNNDVRHFDNSKFKDDYQKPQTTTADNGWWNPTGSGAFRLLDCTVRSVNYLDGSSALSAETDPIVGKVIAGAPDRVSGKLVDLDPQWQGASQIWGMQVRVIDTSGEEMFGGKFEANPFRDLLFGRIQGRTGDKGASAYFQSILEDVAWSKAPRRGRFIDELKEVARTGKLSIRLMTFGYQDASATDGFTTGRVSGVIGPYLEDEPHTYVLGRRFTPAAGPMSWNGINFCVGSLSSANKKNRFFVDLANALPLSNDLSQLDIGALSVGALLNPGAAEGGPVSETAFVSFGAIPYRDKSWLETTGGVVSLDLDRKQMATQRTRPRRRWPL